MPMPKDEREQAILDKLSIIRDQLLLLKRDRTKYIRTQDVIVHYDAVVEQVKELNEIRKGEKVTETRGMRFLLGLLAAAIEQRDLTKPNSRQSPRKLPTAPLSLLHDDRPYTGSPRGLRIDLDHQAITRPPDRGRPLLSQGPEQHGPHPLTARQGHDGLEPFALALHCRASGQPAGALPQLVGQPEEEGGRPAGPATEHPREADLHTTVHVTCEHQGEGKDAQGRTDTRIRGEE